MTRRWLAALALVLALAPAPAQASWWSITPTKDLKKWIGRPAVELLASWGPPVEAFEIGAGARILTWRIWCPLNTPAGGYWRVRTFQINAEGTITAFRWTGL